MFQASSAPAPADRNGDLRPETRQVQKQWPLDSRLRAVNSPCENYWGDLGVCFLYTIFFKICMQPFVENAKNNSYLAITIITIS